MAARRHRFTIDDFAIASERVEAWPAKISLAANNSALYRGAEAVLDSILAPLWDEALQIGPVVQDYEIELTAVARGRGRSGLVCYHRIRATSTHILLLAIESRIRATVWEKIDPEGFARFVLQQPDGEIVFQTTRWLDAWICGWHDVEACRKHEALVRIELQKFGGIWIDRVAKRVRTERMAVLHAAWRRDERLSIQPARGTAVLPKKRGPKAKQKILERNEVILALWRKHKGKLPDNRKWAELAALVNADEGFRALELSALTGQAVREVADPKRRKKRPRKA